MRKQPGFTAVAVLALAFGIGVNTAVFTAFNAVAMRPLQAREAGQMVTLYRTTAEDRWGQDFSLPDYLYLREHNTVFSDVVASSHDWLTLSDLPGGQPNRSSGLSSIAGFRFPKKVTNGAEFVTASVVTENYFSVLGIEAVRGRTFRAGEDAAASATPVVLVSENFWQRRFARSPALLGKTIKLNRAAFTVIGITPAGFTGTNQNVPDIWLPISQLPLADIGIDWAGNREAGCCSLTGRLKPGVRPQQAQAEVSVLEDQLRQIHPPDSKYHKPGSITLWRANALAFHPDPDIYPIVGLTMGAVGLVLLIACANVANLQLAHSAARQKEIGVRLAIGASRARIIRQLLTESSLLAILAGAVGLVVSWWLLTLLVKGIAASLPPEWGTLALEVTPDPRSFAYTLIISLVAGVGFGLAPALQTSSPNLVSVLKQEGWQLGLLLTRGRLLNVFIAGQVSLSLLLLVCAGLLIRGSARSLHVDPGFDAKHVLRLETEFAGGTQYSQEKQTAIIADVIDRIRALPDVKSVSRGNAPLGGGWRRASVALNGERRAPGERAPETFYTYASASYFDTLGISLVLGRFYSDLEAAQKSLLQL